MSVAGFPKYYGKYTSADTSQSGCIKAFASLPREDSLFPPQVISLCDLCHKQHAFKLASISLVATKTQEAAFDEFCIQKHIDRDYNVE